MNAILAYSLTRFFTANSTTEICGAIVLIILAVFLIIGNFTESAGRK